MCILCLGDSLAGRDCLCLYSILQVPGDDPFETAVAMSMTDL